MIPNHINKYQDIGLLILRLGLGIMFLYHGTPEILGGQTAWVKLGTAMKFVGVDFAPAFWGFMAAFSEFIGGILLIVGLFFRPTCLLLLCTMAVAIFMKFGTGTGLAGASPAIEDGIVFFSLLFIGPGKHSLDDKLANPLSSSKRLNLN